MAETYKESLDAVNAIGNEFVGGEDGGGAGAVARALELDEGELLRLALTEQPENIPVSVRSVLAVEFFGGFAAGVRWERSRGE